MASKKKSAATGEIVLPPLEFKPPVSDKQQQQGLLLACRQVEQYPATVMLVAQALKNRADQIMLDYAQQGVAVRFRVNGLWEAMPPMDRATGDPVLVILKRLCVLNPADRRSRQSNKLPLSLNGDWIIEFTSIGTPTGERVLMRIEPKKPILKTLSDLGMRDKMQEQVKAMLNADKSLAIISGPPGHGLPTMWRVALESADKFVRDFHIFEDKAGAEPELINVTQHLFDAQAGETPMTLLPSLLLKQPDVLVLPDFMNEETVKTVCEEVLEENRHAITKVVAPSAVEALIRLAVTYKNQAKQLMKMANGVTNQRLMRRLCDKCKQAFQPQPQLLQKLGIPAGRVTALYQPFVPPPPEQRVDAKGNPVEIEICKQCDGRGYYGRIGVFEFLTVNDAIRSAVLSQPAPAHVGAVAKQQGHRNLQEEAILTVAMGLTSLQELQRVFAPPAPKK
ncbi:MAG: Flp pilus assembly complex ATPase component TadA [Pirellulaceae bacterium]|nr:Flp pilus assembly complex ATPase component TadA [Pirellulaceae bacterium]